MAWWAAAAYAGGALLDLHGTARGVAAEVEAIVSSARAQARDAAALEESLTDQINTMQRNIERGIGRARAQIGASGVQMAGSPMDALLEMHRVGMEDLDAAMRERHVRVNRAYLQAINTTRSGIRTARQGGFQLAGKTFRYLSQASQLSGGSLDFSSFGTGGYTTTTQVYE